MGRPALRCVASKRYDCRGIDEKAELRGELEIELYAYATSHGGPGILDIDRGGAGVATIGLSGRACIRKA